MRDAIDPIRRGHPEDFPDASDRTSGPAQQRFFQRLSERHASGVDVGAFSRVVGNLVQSRK